MSTLSRQNWLSVLAHSEPTTLATLWSQQNLQPNYTLLRAPQTGLAQVQGRMGATGNAYNIGDVTLTRAVVKLASNEIGVGYIAGRNKDHCLRVALVDALLQHKDFFQVLYDNVIKPLRQQRQQATQQHEAATNQSKVDFFTLVRGE